MSGRSFGCLGQVFEGSGRTALRGYARRATALIYNNRIQIVQYSELYFRLFLYYENDKVQ